MVYDPVDDISFYKDKHGNKRVFLPNRHRLFVTNRFNQFGDEEVPATSLQHKIGVKSAFQECCAGEFPPRIVIEGDSGGDSAYRNEKAKHSYGTLAKEEKMDVLILTGPAPNDSAGNPIEQDWAPLKKRLAGMVLPEVVGSDMVSPRKQPEVLKDLNLLRAKELELYTIAGRSVDLAWNGMTVGGHPVKCQFELPQVRSLRIGLGSR